MKLENSVGSRSAANCLLVEDWIDTHSRGGWSGSFPLLLASRRMTMLTRGWTLVLAGVLGLGMMFTGTGSAKADDINRMYHYPFYYFPHNYWPNYQRWPNPRQPFQPAPTWMAYPPYLDQQFTYPLFENKR